MASAVKYIANVGKSVKYATIDVLKDMNPVISDTIETNQDVAKVTYSSIKNFKSLSAKAVKSLSQSQTGELAKELKKNLLEDIKNGTFYNKKREYTGMMDAAMNSDMFSGEDFDFEVVEDDDQEESETMKASRNTVDAVSNVMARTAEYQVEATRQSTNRILAQTTAMTATLHSDLGILNANISGLVKFNAESMSTHLQNSQLFYQRQQEQMQEQTNILKEILDLQKSVLTPKSKRMDSKVNTSDIFTTNGAINLAEYFKMIKQNMSTADPTGLSGILSATKGMGVSSAITSNPLGLVMKMAIEATFPKILKESFAEFNETLSGSMATALINASKAKDSFNPITNLLGNIFGIDLSVKKGINTSSYNKDTVPWNGKDHKALTEVIPTLLSKIYSSLSGTDELRYNFETGKFTSIKTIKSEYNKGRDRYVSKANDTIMPYLNNAISSIDFGSTERQKEFVKNLEKILRQNFKNMEYFNPNDRSKSAKSYGLKGANAERDLELIRRIYSQIPKNKQLKNQQDLLEAQTSINKWLSDMESSGDSVFNALFNKSTSKKGLKSPSLILSDKLDITNSILEDIRNILSSNKSNTTARQVSAQANKKDIILPSKSHNKSTKKNKNSEVKSNVGINIYKSATKKYKYTDDIDSFVFDEDTTNADTYLKKLQKAETATQKLTALLSGTSTLAKQPIKFLSNVLKKTDERMYTLLFGSDKKGKNSILGKITDGLDIWFEQLKDITKEKFNDFKTWLFGKDVKDKANDIFKKLFNIDTKEWFKDFKKSAFGDENISMGEGIRNIFKTGFGEIFQGIKNTFKQNDTIADISSAVKGELNEKGTKKKNYNTNIINDIGKTLNTRALDIQKKAKESGIGETEEIESNATGTRRVSRTGVVAVSEGEMIVPPDMNPYNIDKRKKNEQKSIDKFEKAFNKIEDIQSFAEGGIFDGDNKDRLDNLINKISQNVKNGKTKDLARIVKSISKFSKPARDYILNNLSDETIAAIKGNFGSIRSKIKERYTRDDYVEGKENILYKMQDAAKDIFSDAKENTVVNNIVTKISQSFNKNEKTMSEGKAVVNDIMSNFGKYLPKIAAGGVTGLALSTLLGLAGGPLLGAAVGSGLGLLSNSKKLRTWLFGEKIVDDEGNESIKGGILGNDIKKNIHKYFPNISKGAILGGITSILPFVPGGPMAGILVGSAIGFAKSNDTLSKQLFGEDKALGKMKKTLEQKLPRMGLGAAAMFLGGPFGITTNLMVGAGLGFVSDTNKFKDIVFGTKGSNGERTGGLVQYIKEAVEVPINTAKQIWQETHDWFKDTFLPPLSKAAAPIGRQFKNIGNWFKDALTQGIKDHITRPIGRAITDNIIQPFQKATGFILRQLLRPGRWALGKVSQGIGTIGSKLRSHQLRNIGTASGTAAERLAEMDELDANKRIPFRRFANSKGYRSASLINSLSNEQVLEMQAFNEYLQTAGSAITTKKINKAKTSYAKHIVIANDDMLFNDLKQLADKRIITARTYSDFETAILNADIKTAMNLYKNIQVNDSKNFTSKDKKSLGKRIQAAVNNAKKARADAEKAKEKYKQLKDKYGDIGLGTARFGRELQQEVEGRGINAESENAEEKTIDSVVDISKTQKENHVQLMDALNNISELLEAIAFPESKRALKKKRLEKSIEEKEKKKEEKAIETTATLGDIKTLAEEGMTSEVNSIADGKPVKVSKIKNIIHRFTNKIRQSIDKPQTIITENGPIKTRFDNRGNEIPDNTDSETKETLAKVEDKNQVQKGILNKLSGLGDTIKGFLGIGDDKEEKEEGIFSKILKGALKYGLPILGGLAGVGLVSKIANKKVNVQARDANGNKMFDENGNPIMTQMTIAEAVKDGASRMWLGDDLTGNTNGAWFHIKDFTRNKIVPMIATGYDLIMKTLPGLIKEGINVITDNIPYFVEKLVSALIATAPSVIWAGVKGLVGGLTKALVNVFGGKKERDKAADIEDMGITPTGGVLSNTGTPISSSSTANLSPNAQAIVKSLQSAIDSGNASNFTSSGSSAAISSNIQNTTQAAISKIDTSGININTSANNEDIKKSDAYKNAGEISQSKALDQLAPIWNNNTTFGMSVGDLLNSDTVVGTYTDDNGETHEITGQEILNYPELAKSVLGIDISASDEERNEQRKKQTPSTELLDGLSGNLIRWGGAGLRMFATNGQSGGAIRAVSNINSKAFGLAGNIVKHFPSIKGIPIGKIASLGVKAAGLVNNAPGYIMNGARDYFLNRKSGKGVTDSIKESVGNATKIFREDADTIFSKPEGKKSDNKVFEKIKTSLRNAKDRLEGSKAGKKVKGKAVEILEKLTNMLSNFFKNSTIVKNVKKIFSNVSKYRDSADKLANKFLKNILDYLIDVATKKLGSGSGVAKILTKLSTKLGSYAVSGGTLLIVFAVVDFVIGMKNADAIFQVTEPTIVERVISGLVNAVVKRFGIDIFIDTPQLIQKIIDLLPDGVLSDDYEERHNEVVRQTQEYNNIHESNIDEYEYMMKDKLETKAANFVGSIGNKIAGAAKGVFNFIAGKKSDEESTGETQSTVDQVTAAEETAAGSYVYDDSGNVIGYDNNSDGNVESMYIPQGDSSESSIAGIDTEFNTTGVSSNETVDSTSSIVNTNVDQSQLATSGTGSVISTENQSLINSAYNEINTSIPDMVRQVKTNLANYFGVKPSDLNRTTNVGMNTMKGDGPLQLFRRLNLMWSQVNTTLGPFVRNLPATLYSGMKDLTKFLTNNVGLTTDDEVIGMEEEAEAIGTSSGYSSTSTTTNQSSDSSTTTGKASTSSSSSSSNSSKKKKKDSIFTKISKGVKNVVKGIGNFFGIGGSGSGMDGSVISDYDRSSDKGSFISQKYGKYANRPFTVIGDKSKETVENAGCAPAVATMAINSAGFSASPITMDQAIKTAIQYKKPNSGVTADYFVDEFDKHGLNTAFVTSDSSNMRDTIIRRLSSGSPIILMGKDDRNSSKSNSPFGPKTHYVVATGISKDKQTIYVNDPESSKPKVPYKASKLLNGVMLGIAPVVRSNAKNKANSMITKIKRLLSNFSASGKYGEDTIEYKVWTSLRAAGYSEITVAGTMGNIYAESGFDPSVVEHGNGIGFGLIQWSYNRRTAIENYAAEQGKDVNSVELQIEWLLKECDPNDSAYAWMNSSKSYDGKSWTYDEWKNATDIESAVRSFMFCFERPLNTSSLQKRIDAANEYYEEFTGTAVPNSQDGDNNTGGESEASQSPIEKLLSAFTELAKGYGLTGGDSSGSTEDSGSDDDGSGYVDMGDIRGNVSTNKEYAQKQVELVKKMKSVENQLVYAQNNAKYPGSRNPDDGSGDCSSTVQWAYQKVLGVDPGSWTGAQETDEDTYTVTNSTAEEDKMQLGDIILKDGHVEMYYGDHRMIGHGGGQHTLEDGTVTKKGPFVRELGSTPPYNHIKRWVGFRDGESSTTFDGATEGGAGSGVFVSQNNSSYANKTIGNRTVADAGCAPAVATMALSKMNKNYNMTTAIKDAAKYQNSSGKVTADYFADTFTKNGIRPSFIPGTNIDKLKKSITNGNVVLLGKDSSNNTKSRSPFGSSGHYVLATGLSNDGKYVYIDDPESKKANQKYPVDILKHTSLGISTFGNITSKIADKIKDKLKLLAGTAKYKYLFSGDSRTVGIQLSLGDSKPDTLFVAKVGIGYQWMKDHAWSQIKQNLNDNPDMKVVFLYGVNDMININYYLKRYKELEGEYNKNRIWYVSVNPIRGQQLVTDDQIKEFNTKLKEHAGSRYIDTYSMLQKDGFGSYDGLHYDNDTNIKIYDFIINAINNGGSTSNTTTSNKNTITEVEQDPSPLSELTAAFAELAQGYGLTGKSGSTSTSSSNNNNNNSNNSSTKGSSFPKYDLTDAQKKLAAGVIAGETGGADLVAAKQEASQMANLNEVQYGKDATGSNLESTLTGGWYAKASLSKSPTDTTLKAVEEVLVNGKRTLPRYVTEHDMFPLDAAISGHWNNGKSEDRSQYKRNSTVIHQNPSRFSSPASYKFYDFFGENRDGDVAGYYDQYYDQYKDDVAWSGAGSGLSSDTKPTPSYNYSKSTTKPVIIESTSSNNQKSSNVDKLIEVVVKLLSQVVNNTSSIKDIASLLVKLVDLKGSDDSSNSNSAINAAMTSSQLALQALRESTRTTEDEEIMKLIKSVESIAMQ